MIAYDVSFTLYDRTNELEITSFFGKFMLHGMFKSIWCQLICFIADFELRALSK